MNPSSHVRVFVIFAVLLAVFTAINTPFGRIPSADSSDSTIFGPEVFRREQGKPQTYARRFYVSNSSGRFSLQIINGDADDNNDFKAKRTERVTSAQISLNDVQVVGPSDLKKDVRRLSLPVTLNQGDNTLKVTLNGDPITLLSVAILSGGTPPPPDLTPPSVIAVNPINGAAGVAVNGTIVGVTFSEPIFLDTLSSSSFYLTAGGQGVSGKINPTADRTGAFFAPDAPLAYSTTYTVTVTSAIRDLAGNALTPSFSSIFTTQALPPPPPPPPDITPPRVVRLSPSVGSINNQTSSLVVITFSEAVDSSTLTNNVLVFGDTAQGSGTVVTLDSGSFLVVPNGERVDGTVTPSADKLSATFTPTTTAADGTTKPARLPADATITVVVLTRVKDLAGNNLDQNPAAAGQQFFAGNFATSQFNLTGSTSVARVNPQASKIEAALLPGDEVIVAGGYDQFDQVNQTADVYNQAEES
ncbi:MAG TPA: Ig-like domain-containing protein, partial [Blastocatellia bacterium]|nr:Ig-like domain-containing protein [Blastocatellia bacterium]